MRLRRVRLEHVRGIAACDLSFATDGVTVVEAPNESGKSTVIDAVGIALRTKHGSTRQEVKDLQPVGSDHGSLIHVEFTVDGLQVAVRKRFNRNKEAVLTVTGPAGDPRVGQWSGGQADDQLAALLEDAVDLALFEALWFTQRRALSAPAFADSAVLTQRLDAVAAVGAGERSRQRDGETEETGRVVVAAHPGDAEETDQASLYALASKEYERFYTPTGQVKKRPLGEAADTVAELADTEADLQRQLDQLAERADELEAIERQRPELVANREHAEKRKAELDSMQLAHQKAAQQRETLEERARRIRLQRDERQREQQRRATLDEQHAAIHDQLAQAQQAADQLAAAVSDDRAAQRADLQRDLESAAIVADVAQRLARWWDVAVDAADAAHEHERFQQRYQALLDLREQRQRLSDELAGLLVDDEALARLQTADDHVRELERAANTAAASVQLSVLDGRHVTVDGEQVRLEPNARHQWPVVSRWTALIDGVTVAIDPPADSDKLADELDRARSQRAELFDEHAVSDLQRARSVHQRRMQLAEQCTHLDAQLAREGHDEGFDACRQALAEVAERQASLQSRLAAVPDLGELQALLADNPDPGDADDDGRKAMLHALVEATPTDGKAALDTAEARTNRDAARSIADRAAHERDRLRQRRDALEEEHQRWQHNVHDAQRTVEHLEQQRDLLDEQRQRARAEVSDDELANQLADDNRQLADLDDQIEAIKADETLAASSSLDTDLQACRTTIANLTQRLDDSSRREAAAQATIETLGGQGLGEALAHTRAALQRASEEHARLLRHAEAAKLLYETLEAARRQAYNAYRAPLREQINTLLSGLYARNDVAVDLGDDLQIVARQLDGQTLGFDQLSAGAREQLALVAGLAVAMLAGDDGVPFVLDDALGFTDEQRLARLGVLLSRTRDAQIIVLTCLPGRFAAVDATFVPLASIPSGGPTAATDGMLPLDS